MHGPGSVRRGSDGDYCGKGINGVTKDQGQRRSEEQDKGKHGDKEAREWRSGCDCDEVDLRRSWEDPGIGVTWKEREGDYVTREDPGEIGMTGKEKTREGGECVLERTKGSLGGGSVFRSVGKRLVGLSGRGSSKRESGEKGI